MKNVVLINIKFIFIHLKEKLIFDSLKNKLFIKNV